MKEHISAPQVERNRWATTSLACGTITWVLVALFIFIANRYKSYDLSMFFTSKSITIIVIGSLLAAIFGFIAHSRSKRFGIFTGRWCYITGIILGITAAVFFPTQRVHSFNKAIKDRQISENYYGCMNNMFKIYTAKEQIAQEEGIIEDTAVIPADKITKCLLNDGTDKIACPDGGVYTAGALDTWPRCLVHGPLHPDKAFAAPNN